MVFRNKIYAFEFQDISFESVEMRTENGKSSLEFKLVELQCAYFVIEQLQYNIYFDFKLATYAIDCSDMLRIYNTYTKLDFNSVFKQKEIIAIN